MYISARGNTCYCLQFTAERNPSFPWTSVRRSSANFLWNALFSGCFVWIRPSSSSSLSSQNVNNVTNLIASESGKRKQNSYNWSGDVFSADSHIELPILLPNFSPLSVVRRGVIKPYEVAFSSRLMRSWPPSMFPNWSWPPGKKMKRFFFRFNKFQNNISSTTYRFVWNICAVCTNAANRTPGKLDSWTLSNSFHLHCSTVA